jgi:hypothetical protein
MTRNVEAPVMRPLKKSVAMLIGGEFTDHIMLNSVEHGMTAVYEDPSRVVARFFLCFVIKCVNTASEGCEFSAAYHYRLDVGSDYIELRYGIDRNGKELTQKEVADIMGISQSYISRLEKKIIVQLKDFLIKQNY